jgi:hypothetical protein
MAGTDAAIEQNRVRRKKVQNFQDYVMEHHIGGGVYRIKTQLETIR